MDPMKSEGPGVEPGPTPCTNESTDRRPVGAVFPALTLRYLGMVYEQIGTRPHTTRDGRLVTFVIWRGSCADCGAPFETGTPIEVNPAEMNRRCDVHKAPGKPVAAVRRQRAAVHKGRKRGRR